MANIGAQCLALCLHFLSKLPLCVKFHICYLFNPVKFISFLPIFFEKMASQIEKRKIIISKYLEEPSKSINSIAKELKFPESTCRRVIKKYKESLSVDRVPGSGRKPGLSNPALAQKVVKYAEKYPNSSVRLIALKLDTSKSWVQKVLRINGLRSYKVQKSTNRSDQQARRAKVRSRKLYDTLLRGQNRCILMDDESYVVSDFAQLPGRSFYRSRYRFGVKRQFKYQRLSKFPGKYMIWQAICSCGRKSASFVAKGNMKCDDYIKECLNKRLLPLIKSHTTKPLFWPDLAAIHYAKKALEWYDQNEVLYVPKELNPPNCPQLRPIETFWAQVKRILKQDQKVAKNAKSFHQYWISAAKKVDKDLVQRLMAGLPMKVLRFSRTAIDDQL